MKAEIITIGDEILIGQIIDTNSAWMAVELNQIGISIEQITTISDSPEHLVNALNEAKSRASVVLITGGLGPTKDDRTKKVLCEYFDSSMVLHRETLEHVSLFFKNRGLDVNNLNHDQAMVPECCEVLFNAVGTAPGMLFEKDETIFVSMPGVPFEMKSIMSNYVIPRLQTLGNKVKIHHKTILTIGIPESILAEKLEFWENNLPENIKLAYLPSPGIIRLRLSAFGENEEELTNVVEVQIKKLKQIIPNSIFGYNKETLAEVIGNLLKDKKQNLACAESCTGGFISHLITSVPGSSVWFKGTVIAYSNEIKQLILNVGSKTLLDYGAVSEEVVIEMADGVRKLMNTDYAIATSGIAGPDGGTFEKPIGLVWIAISGKGKTIAQQFNFANNRERNIIRSSQTALDLLRLFIVE